MQDNPHNQGFQEFIIINVTSISPILQVVDIKMYIPIWHHQTLTVRVLLKGVCVCVHEVINLPLIHVAITSRANESCVTPLQGYTATLKIVFMKNCNYATSHKTFQPLRWNQPLNYALKTYWTAQWEELF